MTYLTPTQAADLLQLPLFRVYELCRLGTIPHARLRRQIRIDADRLKAFMDSGGMGVQERVANSPLGLRT